jgi:hypothetical protein
VLLQASEERGNVEEAAILNVEELEGHGQVSTALLLSRLSLVHVRLDGSDFPSQPHLVVQRVVDRYTVSGAPRRLNEFTDRAMAMDLRIASRF